MIIWSRLYLVSIKIQLHIFGSFDLCAAYFIRLPTLRFFLNKITAAHNGIYRFKPRTYWNEYYNDGASHCSVNLKRLFNVLYWVRYIFRFHPVLNSRFVIRLWCHINKQTLQWSPTHHRVTFMSYIDTTYSKIY